LLILLRSIRLTFREYAAALTPAVAASAAMCLALFAINSRLPASLPVPAHLAIQVLVGGAVYGGFMMCFFRGRLLRYVNFLGSLRKAKAM
jgi:hypothetical protein